MTDVIVTQEDREAAASNILKRLIFQHGGEQPWMDASTASMRMGEQDDHWEVQAFAQHRIKAALAMQEVVRGAMEKGYPADHLNECGHGKFGFEDCVSCYDEFIEATMEAAIRNLEVPE